MNITEIELTNFGSWAGPITIPIEPGVTLISGVNGAGKSTLLQAMRFALYGSSSDAGHLIRRGHDRATVAVEVTTDAGELHVERTIRRSGTKTIVSLELSQHVDGQFPSLTCATTTETQQLLENLLGISLELVEASAWSMQGSGAQFCEAAPRDRKRIFSSMIGLEFWDALAADAKRDAATASAEAQAARARLEQLDGAEGRLLDARDAVCVTRSTQMKAAAAEVGAESEVARLAGEAEAARETRRRHTTATEAAQRARADHKRATAETAVAQESLERTKAAAANAPSVADAKALVGEWGYALAQTEARHSAAVTLTQRHEEALAVAGRELAELQGERETGECARCGQPLHADVTERLVEAVRAFRALEAVAPPAPDTAKLTEVREAAEEAQRKLAEAQTIHSLAGSIEAAEERTRVAAARQSDTSEIAFFADEAAIETAREAEGIPADIEARHATATAALEQARVDHRQAVAALAAAEAAAKTAERDAADEQAARQLLAEAELEAAIAGILAAGFGPQGVPAMIVDGVLADLAVEANRVLTELASPIRVDLRSQKLLKTSDRLADTLDIIALMDAQETPWERLSGGERTRVAIALRAALTRLLASKRGARVRILVIDEPAGLDRDGSENLAGVLREFVTAGVFDTVLLVTHQTELADQIGRVIRVQRAPGGDSRLAESTAGSLSPQTPSSDPAEHRHRKADHAPA